MSTRPDQSAPLAERVAAIGLDYDALPKEEIRSCNLCGGINWTVVAHEDRYGFPATSVACNRCSLTFLSPRLTKEVYVDFYRDTYRPLVSAYHGRLIDHETIQVDQGYYATDLIKFVSPYIARVAPRTVLDIGGSTGVVSRAVSDQFGMVATVLDPSQKELEEAEKAGAETVHGFIEDWTGEDRVFGVILMCQTIDHLLDIHAALGKIRGLLAQDGLFVVDIVDFRAAYLRAWSVERATKIDHPSSLTELTIEAFFKRCGFQPIAKSYSRDHLHISYLCEGTATDPAAEPSAAGVERFFEELRFVQNAPRPFSE